MIPFPIGLYNFLQVPALAGYLPWALLSSKRRPTLPARLGLELPLVRPGGLWVHALSLGEVISARPLLLELQKSRPETEIYLSASTDSGLKAALGEVEVGRAKAAFRAPWDLYPAVARTLDRLEPRGLILVETDIWPNLLWACRRKGVPAGLVNFRISPARHRGHARLRSFFAAVYGLLSFVALPTDLDRERWEYLRVRGVKTHVTGSLKYDQPLPVPVSPRELGLEQGRQAVIAGSTHPGEEEAVLTAWAGLRKEIPDLALILAPRNMERVDEVLSLMDIRGIKPARLSQGQGLAHGPVLVVDVLGRLASLYGSAGAAFVGGSLVPLGGHNVLEPASLGVPVCFGPHMENFTAEARRLTASGGGAEVRDTAGLAAFWRRVLLDREAGRIAGDAARQTYLNYRGAAQKIVELMGEALGWPTR